LFHRFLRSFRWHKVIILPLCNAAVLKTSTRTHRNISSRPKCSTLRTSLNTSRKGSKTSQLHFVSPRIFLREKWMKYVSQNRTSACFEIWVSQGSDCEDWLPPSGV
jgi:hypothetical protein